MNPRFKVPLFVQVIIGVGLGALLGVFGRQPIVFGVTNGDLGELGMLVIRLLKALAVPLVLFAILDAFLRTKISARSGGKLLMICAVNVAVAFGIGLTLMNTLRPGESSRAALAELSHASAVVPGPVSTDSLSPLRALQSYVPESLVDPFVNNAVIPVVLLALLVGAALRRVKESPEGDVKTIESLVRGGYQLLVQMLAWVVLVVPLAVFGIVAQVVGKSGLGIFSALGPFLGIVVLGFALHALVYYPLMAWWVGRKSPRVYLGGGADAILTGLSTNSSLATVPITVRCLTEKMGVSSESARLSACVGTNLNNDGITLYEAMAALFIAQALGIDLTLGQQAVVVGASLMAGIGIAGIPEAGLVMLPLVLGAVGLPTPMVAVALAFVLPVDWILARCRSGVNVMSDMLVAILLDRGSVEAPAPAETLPLTSTAASTAVD